VCCPAAAPPHALPPQQLSARLERVARSSSKSEEVQVLEAEVAHWRKKCICSVCDRNEKRVIITKCFHMFCHECMTAAHLARNRQCPSCGRKYQHSDVQEFYQT
jgi:E3 ubiquitin-protein ligase BRE1